MEDPAIGKRYNKALQKARLKANLPNQIFWLEQRAINNTFDDYDAKLFEYLITLDDQLREQCKIKIRKKYAGQVEYSATIGKDRKTIRLWNLVLKRL